VRIDPANPPYEALRLLLRQAFTPQTLAHLDEKPPFQGLRYLFGSRSLDDMIDVVFDYCRTQLYWEELLDAVAGTAPRTYNAFAAQRGWPPVPEPRLNVSEPPPPVPGPLSPAYGDVELHVTGDPDRGYTVTIQTPLSGAASDAMEKPWTQEDLSRWLVQLELGQVDRDTLAGIGKQLFLALFGSHVRDCYVEARGKAQAGLRLRLWFDPPELQVLPWELLFDAGPHRFLALSKRVLVTRYLAVLRGTPPLAVTPPLRILIATALPRDQPPLDVEAEAVAIRRALAPLETQGLVRLEVLPHAQVMALRQALLDLRPHVLHFAGHGTLSRDGGALVLEDEVGLSRPCSSTKLGIMLADTDVRLAVLNACLSARGAAVEAGPFDEQRRALLGVGPALVEAGLGAVIAMQFSMSDSAARLFAADLYRSLARLEPVDQAVSRAREALMMEGLDEGDRNWATPVLFLRAPDGVIFVPTSPHAHGTDNP
jgi:hypothetical protein